MAKEYTRALTTLGIIPIAGQIIFHDDFESLLHWTKYSGAGDDIFELDPTIAKHGNQSLYIKSRTTGAAQYDIIGAEQQIHALPSQDISFTVSFHYPSRTAIDYIVFYFALFDGVDIHTPQIRFKPNVPSWEYYNDAPSYVTLPALAHELAINTWHSFTLKVRYSTDFYHSLQVDHFLADLSDKGIYNTANPADIFLRQRIEFRTAAAAPAELYLDDVLVHEL